MTAIVRKAVLPVAGLGKRFLLATKAIPNEMIALIDKPIVQHAVEGPVVTAPDKSRNLHLKRAKVVLRRATLTDFWDTRSDGMIDVAKFSYTTGSLP